MTIKRIVESPLVLHRGASAYAPENTLDALKRAADMGAEWVETDVQVTADGGLVMIHDKTVDRTTNGTGDVAKLSTQDIRALDAGSWFGDGRFDGARVPLLSDYLGLAQDLGVGVQLEIKHVYGWEERVTERVCAAVCKEWQDPQKLVFSSFSERCMKLVADKAPDFPRCIAVTALPKDPAGRLQETGCHILHAQHSWVDVDDLAELVTSGIEFAVATINSPERARYFLEHGAASVLTDRPDLLSET